MGSYVIVENLKIEISSDEHELGTKESKKQVFKNLSICLYTKYVIGSEAYTI